MSELKLNFDVHNRLMLESIIENTIKIDSKYFSYLCNNEILEDENKDYENKHRDLKKAFDSALNEDGLHTRRAYISWPPNHKGTDNCISLIQLLYRDKKVLNVYMRSSDIARFQSDLGFFSRIALEYNVDIIQITIGSLHFYLNGD